MLALHAAEELEAEERLAFVTDMSVVVGSLFPGKGQDPPSIEHVYLLSNIAAGVVYGDGGTQSA